MKDLRTNTDRPKFKSPLTLLLRYFAGLFILMLFMASCSKDSIESEPLNDTQEENFHMNAPNTWQAQVAILDRKTRKFENFQVAQAAGYTLLVSPYVPNMGYHYLNPNLVNGEFNLLKPEILVYHPDENGTMIFGAAEYLVPVDVNNPPPHPEGFSGDEDEWHLNPAAGGWTLHAWVGMDNPDGVFVAYNPDVPVAPAGN